MFAINRGKFFKIILYSWITFLSIVFAAFLYFWALESNFLNLFGEIPALEELENPKNELASEIYTADNILMGKYYRENRTPVEYDELSPYLVNALIATEDIRFEEHSGIDLEGIARAVVYNVILGNRSQGGGSTLTQQLAKNLFKLRREDKFKGLLYNTPIFGGIVLKSKEWLTAIRIEENYTKDRKSVV